MSVDGAGWVEVGVKSDIRPGRCKVFEAGEERVLISRVGDSFHATQPLCTHARVELGPGRLSGDCLECPMHSALFDPATGAVLDAPATKALNTYPVVVDGDSILVDPTAPSNVDGDINLNSSRTGRAVAPASTMEGTP